MNKIAIVVGHDKVEQGAFSPYLQKSEYKYHSEVAVILPFDVYFRSTSGGYKTKMEVLAKEINKKDYDLVVELHFNSFNSVANGTECLYLNGSVIGKRWAEVYSEKISKAYSTTNRGAKEISGSNQNGYWFLKLMKAPAIIVEPFFADHKEALKFTNTNDYAKRLYEIFC